MPLLVHHQQTRAVVDVRREPVASVLAGQERPFILHPDDLPARRLVVLLADVPPLTDRFRLLWRRDHPLRTALFQLAEDLRALPVR
jgi:hypothetical protein